MKKFGFTLVEMLAVITILGVVLLVAIPSIQNQVNSRRKDVDERTEQMILSAAENLVAGNPNTYLNVYSSESDHNTYCLTIQTLIDADMLEEPVKNYSTGKEINHNRAIKVDVNKNKEFVYTLLKDNDPCIGKTTKLTLYKDSTLAVSNIDSENPYPEIYTGMIPVEYDSEYSVWRKANLYTNWYKYGNNSIASNKDTEFRWANAVTVREHSSDCESTKTCIDNNKSHSRDYYENAPAGTKISMDDITGMYVWIPRFQYKITGTYGTEDPSGSGTPSAQSPGAIDVKFMGTNTSLGSGYHMSSAFKFGTSNLAGFWFSKFEASTETGSDCYKTPNATNCNKTLNTYILPNKNSWTYIDIANAFQSAINMSESKNIHGLRNTQIDTHVAKNSEWGAVAVLSQSQYGIRHSNSSDSQNREVYVNNYYSGGKYWTGCSAGAPASEKKNDSGNYITPVVTSCSAEHQYNNSTSAKGTTSGTIYGIYDMTGGAREFTLATLKSADWGNYRAKFVGKNKYFNFFETTDPSTACSNSICYGHALSETKTWNGDDATFVAASYPYLYRGSDATALNTSGQKAKVGIFTYGNGTGAASIKDSFRVSITRKGYDTYTN